MVVLKPTSPVENEIFQFFCDADPSSAFNAGLSEYSGKIFVPSSKNLAELARRANNLRLKAETESQVKLIDSMAAMAALGEPHSIPETVLSAYFGYLVKEGIVPSHLKQLTRSAVRVLQTGILEKSGKKWPVGLRLLTLIRCDGLQEIIRTIRKETTDKQLRSQLDELSGLTRKYAGIFRVSGFHNKGFSEIYRIMKKEGCALDREATYAQSLRYLWDYPETPEEVEQKGVAFLKRELPRFKILTARLAKKYTVAARAEDVAEAMKKKRWLKPQQVVPFLNELRDRVVRVVNKEVVGVNPKYDTKVIETPLFLSGIFPSGGAYFFDYFTNNPKNIFMATTDPRRDPHTIPGELLNLLVHEEYGHCVHSSNSATQYAAKPAITDMLWSPLGCMSEGISFQRELEFQKIMDRLTTRKSLTRDERTLLAFFEEHGGFDQIAEEYQFFTAMWRIVRFLRVIGDVRINSGTQGLADFVDWGNRTTGLSKSMVYHQLFPAHQGIGPGYASTYAIIGESIREIQNKAIRNEKSLRDFNSYACSMGFPPRTIFEERLRQYAAN